jgi:hypothetical protein
LDRELCDERVACPNFADHWHGGWLEWIAISPEECPASIRTVCDDDVGTFSQSMRQLLRDRGWRYARSLPSLETKAAFSLKIFVGFRVRAAIVTVGERPAVIGSASPG